MTTLEPDAVPATRFAITVDTVGWTAFGVLLLSLVLSYTSDTRFVANVLHYSYVTVIASGIVRVAGLAARWLRRP